MSSPKNVGGDPDALLEDRRRWFGRILSVVLVLFAAGATLGAAQVGRALWSRAAWVNYRGEVVTATEMWRELAFFVLVAIVCWPLAWYFRRYWRRR
jgi:uncharacterized membrane protein YidH (DUF202 family)